MIIKCDNQSSIKLENDLVYHSRTKNVDTQFHFVREKIQSNDISLMYCNARENVADIFTKPLGKIKFELFIEMLGVDVNPFSIKGETQNNGELVVVTMISFHSFPNYMSLYIYL